MHAREGLQIPRTLFKYLYDLFIYLFKLVVYIVTCTVYISYVVLGHRANLCRVQNGQDGRPLRSRCVRLKYSLRTALNEKEIVRNEAYTPTFPPGKDTGIGRRNIANSSSSTLENSQDPKRSTLQITPIIQCHRPLRTLSNTTASEPSENRSLMR